MTADQFVAEVETALSDTRAVDPLLGIGSVFGVLNRHISQGQIRKVCDALPRSIREMWENQDRMLIVESIETRDF